MVQAHDGSQQLLTGFADTPAPRPRDFRQPSPDVQALA
jgi:hypothetical protein